MRAHLKALEQKEANSPQRRRWQEIIKLKSTKWKQKELYKESSKPGDLSLLGLVSFLVSALTVASYKESMKPGAGSLRKSTR